MIWWDTLIGGALALAIAWTAFTTHTMHRKIDLLRTEVEALHARLWKIENPNG